MAEIFTFLGFDVGTKKTGVAIANSLTSQARGVGVIRHHKDGRTNWDDIDKIIKQYQPQQCVIGMPLDNGKMQKMSYIAQSFGKKLAKKYQLQINYVDEYFSTATAKQQLKWDYRHPNAKRSEVDKQAASLILQTWLNGTTN